MGTLRGDGIVHSLVKYDESRGIKVNKSHSVAYSFLTYITAWLKANYTSEFFCALMTVRSRNMQPKLWAQKASEYIEEALKLGVVVRPPSVNKSQMGFSIDENGHIYFGLNAIRDVGAKAAHAIAQARRQKPYRDVIDFVTRVNSQRVNTKVFTALIYAGAFDHLGYMRAELIEKVNEIYEYPRALIAAEERKLEIIERDRFNEELEPVIERRNELRKLSKRKTGRALTQEELDFLEETKGLRKKPKLKEREIPDLPELTRSKQVSISLYDLIKQAEYIGCFIGTHPTKLISRSEESLSSVWSGQNVRLCVIVTTIKEIKTKRNRKMAFLGIQDYSGNAELIIFPSVWEPLLKNDIAINPLDVLFINAKVEEEEPGLKLIANSIEKYRSG